MICYSTQNPGHRVSFREAVMRGLPPDNGLYMPVEIPVLPAGRIRDFSEMTLREIALEMARPLLGDSLEITVLREIIEKAFTFDAPLVQLESGVFTQELFHGPTLAFKDFAARFMAQVMGHFVQNESRELVILVATSGDTGSAVASGFLKVPGIRVIVLYPAGKVSDIQEKQLTTMGHNITALQIEGTFDDCQRLVKSAFLDAGLRRSFYLTSANSINIARLIPQSFYYAYGWSRLPAHGGATVFSVPSGNFGNLTAGLMAKRMGVPIQRFVAATNANDVVPQFLETGEYHPRTSRKTLSNAMDVGNPSNFARMLALYENDLDQMREDIRGYGFTDAQTVAAMQAVYDTTGYVLDPHGAVGYLGLQRFRKAEPGKWQGVFLETAHPAKFLDIVTAALKTRPAIPERLQTYLEKSGVAIPLSSNFETFKSFLFDTLGDAR